MFMKNVVVSSVAYMIVLLFMLGCSGQSKQSKEKDVVTESVEVLNVKENMLSTLELDGMKVTWIRDNAKDRLMPRSLFPDATDAQIDSLSLQNGVPASVSAFLVEKDGKYILFDSGVGAPDSKLLEGLKTLGVAPSDIDYIFIIS